MQNKKVNKIEIDKAYSDALSLAFHSPNIRFFGAVLQSLNVKFDDTFRAVAGIMVDKKLRQFIMIINPKLFLSLPEKERAPVLVHEMFHVFHKHVFLETSGDRLRRNIAMDLAINDYIHGLPEGCCYTKNFKDKDGKIFDPFGTHNYYYSILTDESKTKVSKQKGDETKDDQQQEASGGNGGDEWRPWREVFKGHDSEHDWWEGANEEELKEITRDFFKRAEYLAEKSHSTIPGFVKDLMDEFYRKCANIDYKYILAQAIKNSIPSRDRDQTWARPSRRFGVYAKGSKFKNLPKIGIYADSSGSISREEIREFFEATSGFFTVGVEKTDFGLFHTDMYHKETIKKDFDPAKLPIQSGGTELTSTFQDAQKSQYDLIIVITDGYFDTPDVDFKKLPKVITILSKNGNEQHPLRAYGPTVKIP